MRNLRPVRRADVVSLLLNRIDVHPVAVEIARADLMRVLPAQPSAGQSAIRVRLGDSLLGEKDRNSLFAKDSMRLVTPKGHTILIPEGFVRQDGFSDNMRRLVEAAVAGESIPRAVLGSVDQRSRNELEQCRADLTVAIGDEGNAVWT